MVKTEKGHGNGVIEVIFKIILLRLLMGQGEK